MDIFWTFWQLPFDILVLCLMQFSAHAFGLVEMFTTFWHTFRSDEDVCLFFRPVIIHFAALQSGSLFCHRY